MSFGIVRVQKFSSGGVKGIEIHDRRKKDGVSHTNKDIDWTRTNENFDLHFVQNKNFQKAVKERINELALPKAVRKDAVVMAQVLVTSDSDFFGNMYTQAACEAYVDTPFTESSIREAPGYRCRVFFQDAYNFLADRYGRENIISATVHMDERTPHMHFNFVPVTADGRLCAKDILTRKSLIDQQTAFYEHVGKRYGLERGEPEGSGKRRKHLETAEYKDMLMEIDEMRHKAAKIAQEAVELREAIKPLQDTKSALEGKIEGMRDMLSVMQRVAIKNYDQGKQELGLEEWRKRIEQAKAEADGAKRLALLERFVSHPQIASAFEQFRIRSNKNEKERNDLSR